jgi:hypothetical protein
MPSESSLQLCVVISDANLLANQASTAAPGMRAGQRTLEAVVIIIIVACLARVSYHM